MNYRDVEIYCGDKAKYISDYDTTYYYSMRCHGRLYGVEINNNLDNKCNLVDGKCVVRAYHEPNEVFENYINLDEKRDYDDAILYKRGLENHESAIEYVFYELMNKGGLI